MSRIREAISARFCSEVGIATSSARLREFRDGCLRGPASRSFAATRPSVAGSMLAALESPTDTVLTAFGLRTFFSAARAARRCRRSRCSTMSGSSSRICASSGVAMKIEEYAPAIMPTNSARPRSFSRARAEDEGAGDEQRRDREHADDRRVQ